VNALRTRVLAMLSASRSDREWKSRPARAALPPERHIEVVDPEQTT
jgi:hypothetical protein